MINCRGDFKQRNNQNNSHTLRNFHRACEFQNSFRMGCEISHTLRINFSHPAKISQPLQINSHTLQNFHRPWEKFRTLCETLRGLWSNFAHYAKLKRRVRKWKVVCHFFLNPPPPPLKSPFCKHSTPCESLIFLCHLGTSPLSIRYRAPRASHFEDSIPRTLRAQTRGSPFISDMTRTRWALLVPSPIRTPRQRASSTQVPSDSPSQPWRPRAFHLLRVERPLVLPHLLLSADTRWGDHLLHQGWLLRALGVHYNALRPRGLGLQAQTSHPELPSLLKIRRFLMTCHQRLLSDALWSQHRLLRATQTAELDPSTWSYILIRRPCDSSLSSETLMAYSKGTTLSTSWLLLSSSILE